MEDIEMVLKLGKAAEMLMCVAVDVPAGKRMSENDYELLGKAKTMIDEVSSAIVENSIAE